MSRNSYRGLVLVIALIVGLGIALPAVAGPAERGLAVQEGLLDRLWNWVEHLWREAAQPGKDLRSVTAAAGSCEHGATLDPNGAPCHR
jgi:hypothetical protein